MEEPGNDGALQRYTGIATFMRAPLIRDPARLDIALIGVPFDGGSENRPGQRHAPREIRNMSSFMRAIHHVTRVNPYELCRIADMGDDASRINARGGLHEVFAVIGGPLLFFDERQVIGMFGHTPAMAMGLTLLVHHALGHQCILRPHQAAFDLGSFVGQESV